MTRRLADALILLGVLCVLAAFWLDATTLRRRTELPPQTILSTCCGAAAMVY